ncbi:MAG: FkbM family methyltransferase [Gloeomargarita sp. SKYBB_i_bin120]|nr:FkbM family methyltransferase [Gloeomargarita sp. SKYG98]MCS7291378.1 FkbM family methyltransferase [Gloeomargarita sp. SKYB120]MDW8176938.1 FkbM family methyltransferase [Gloeomargarita sp. SKYBB_i_bin120]
MISTLKAALKPLIPASLRRPLKRRLQQALSYFRPEFTPITPGGLDVQELVQLLGKDNPVILEIGCNNGEHTVQFLECFPRAKIYCFEPDPRAIADFQQRLGNDPRVQLYPIAISNQDGEIPFFMSDTHPDAAIARSWYDSGSIRRPKRHLERFPWIVFEKTITVPTQRLDTWCQAHSITQIDFIWADVQGAEVDLIQGGKQTLEKTRYFYTEYSNVELYEGQINLAHILRLLPNFRLVYRFAGDVLLQNQRLQ